MLFLSKCKLEAYFLVTLCVYMIKSRYRWLMWYFPIKYNSTVYARRLHHTSSVIERINRWMGLLVVLFLCLCRWLCIGELIISYFLQLVWRRFSLGQPNSLRDKWRLRNPLRTWWRSAEPHCCRRRSSMLGYVAITGNWVGWGRYKTTQMY